MQATQNRPIDLLLVEDNLGDVRLFSEAMAEAQLPNTLKVVQNGQDALDVLRRGKQDGTLPDIVFLDLNLPGIDGRDVLKELKSDPGLRRIPVIVLTSSDAQDDVIRAYNLHANCYIVKPVSYDSLMTVLRAVEEFWLTIVRLPPRS